MVDLDRNMSLMSTKCSDELVCLLLMVRVLLFKEQILVGVHSTVAAGSLCFRRAILFITQKLKVPACDLRTTAA